MMNIKKDCLSINVKLPPSIHQGKKIAFVVELGGRNLAGYFGIQEYDKYRPVGNLTKIRGGKDFPYGKFKDESNQIWKVEILWLKGMLWKYPEENELYEQVERNLMEGVLSELALLKMKW